MSSQLPDVTVLTEKKPRRLRNVLLVFALLIAAVLCVRSLGEKKLPPMNIHAIGKPNAQEAARISVESTPHYATKLDTYSERKAGLARSSEESFIAPVSNVRERTVNVPTKPPKQAPPPKSPVPAPREKPARSTQDSQRKKRMLEALAALPVETPTRQEVILWRGPLPLQQTSGATKRMELPRTPFQTASQDAASPISLAPGDILYAVNRLTLTSDAPGPALADIVEGPFRGARALGSFQQHKERMVLTFSELITKDRKRLSIKGYGIDPRSDTTALASHVDRHLLERYGALFAASFLEGFASAVKNSGSLVYHAPYTNGIYNRPYDLGEQAIIGFGKVGERAATSLQQHSEIPPTVTVDAGIDIAILIVACDPRP